MSNASVRSTKREVQLEELESIRVFNNALKMYLEHLRNFKKTLITVNDNCKQLSKVNSEWIETLSNRK